MMRQWIGAVCAWMIVAGVADARPKASPGNSPDEIQGLRDVVDPTVEQEAGYLLSHSVGNIPTPQNIREMACTVAYIGDQQQQGFGVMGAGQQVFVTAQGCLVRRGDLCPDQFVYFRSKTGWRFAYECDQVVAAPVPGVTSSKLLFFTVKGLRADAVHDGEPLKLDPLADLPPAKASTVLLVGTNKLGQIQAYPCEFGDLKPSHHGFEVTCPEVYDIKHKGAVVIDPRHGYMLIGVVVSGGDKTFLAARLMAY